jgi:hypothetical protein
LLGHTQRPIATLKYRLNHAVHDRRCPRAQRIQKC